MGHTKGSIDLVVEILSARLCIQVGAKRSTTGPGGRRHRQIGIFSNAIN